MSHRCDDWRSKVRPSITLRECDVKASDIRFRRTAAFAAAEDQPVGLAKTYVTRLLAKLDARDRVHLVIIAYQAGVVTPGDVQG